MPNPIFQLRFSLPVIQTGIPAANTDIDMYDDDKYITKKSLKIRICPADMTCRSDGIQLACLILKMTHYCENRGQRLTHIFKEICSL